MKKFKILFTFLTLILCVSTLIGCSDKASINNENNDMKIYIGDDGNWYINDVNTGKPSSGSNGKTAYELAVEQGYKGTLADWLNSLNGEDGSNGKSAYELAVEQGYNGSLDQWLSEMTGSDGKINIYDKETGKQIECDIIEENGKVLLVNKKTEIITTEFGTLNEIAFDEKTYKEIFEDNNCAPVNMNSMMTSFDTYTNYSGTTTIQSDVYNTSPSAMYVSGTTSQQAKSGKTYTGTYYIAAKIMCTRYEQGYIGIIFGTDNSKYEDTTLQFQFDEFETCSSVQTLSGQNIFIGSAISANLDGYIDDPVIINLNIFNETPSKTNLDRLYERYLLIVNGKVETNITHEEVTTETVYYLGEKSVQYSDGIAKFTFMKYMNEKAVSIGMKNTNFVDAAGFYNTTTAYDLLRMGVYACSYDDIVETWHKNAYSITVSGPNARTESITTTVAGSALENYYFLYGGKTGSLTNQVNLLAVVEGPDERLFVIVILGSQINRFEAAKQAMDIAVIKYNNPNADISSYDVACNSAAVCVVPKNNTKAYTDYDLNILYKKNITTPQAPASITKVMTAICMLDFVNDINESFTINASDITSGSGNIFGGGDIITYKEALHAMLLPSSNTAAEATATAVGHKILYYNSK